MKKLFLQNRTLREMSYLLFYPIRFKYIRLNWQLTFHLTNTFHLKNLTLGIILAHVFV